MCCRAQYEAQNKALNSTLQSVEEKKAELEGTMDELKQQLNDLRTELLKEETGELPRHSRSAVSMRPSVEKGGVANNDAEVDRLRQEIVEKEVEIENITQ